MSEVQALEQIAYDALLRLVQQAPGRYTIDELIVRLGEAMGEPLRVGMQSELRLLTVALIMDGQIFWNDDGKLCSN